MAVRGTEMSLILPPFFGNILVFLQIQLRMAVVEGEREVLSQFEMIMTSSNLKLAVPAFLLTSPQNYPNYHRSSE